MNDNLRRKINSVRVKLSRLEAKAERIKLDMVKEFVKKTKKSEETFAKLREKRRKTLVAASKLREFLLENGASLLNIDSTWARRFSAGPKIFLFIPFLSSRTPSDFRRAG